MAYTEVPLPKDTWVAVTVGPAEGLVTASAAGDIRVRAETSAPPASELGTPMSPEGNNFNIASGDTLYAKCVNLDSICHLELD